MFLFTIVPFPLSSDSNNKPVNYSDPINKIEHDIMALESQLTSAILDPSSGGNIESLRSQLNTARNEEFRLRNTLNQTWGEDSEARISDIIAVQGAVDQRTADIQRLLKQLSTDPNGNVDEVSGLTYMVPDPNFPGGARMTADFSTVAQAHDRILEYKSELNRANTFWDKIISSHADILSQTAPPVPKDQMILGTNPSTGEIVGINRIQELQNMLLGFAKNSNNPNFGYVVSGLKGYPGAIYVTDPQVIRTGLQSVKAHFISNLRKAQGESWFTEVKTEVLQRNQEISIQIFDAVNKEKQLAQLLKELLENDPTGESANLTALKKEIAVTQKVLSELKAEKKLWSKVLSPKRKPKPLKGDISGDGVIGAKDYNLLEQVLSGYKLVTSDQRPNADINKDGKIDSLDLAALGKLAKPPDSYTNTRIRDTAVKIVLTMQGKRNDNLTLLKKDLYDLLVRVSKRAATDAKKAAIDVALQQAVSGSISDLNEDGKLDNEDLVFLLTSSWKNS